MKQVQTEFTGANNGAAERQERMNNRRIVGKGGLGSFVTEAFLSTGATVVGVSRSIQARDFSHPEFYAMPAELSSGDAALKLSTVWSPRFGRIDPRGWHVLRPEQTSPLAKRALRPIQKPTRVLQEIIAKGRTAMVALNGLMLLRGGVPNIIDSQIIGAVGVIRDMT